MLNRKQYKVLDLAQAIKDFLSTQMTLYAPISLGTPDDTGNTISYIMAPAATSTRHYNGRSRQVLTFQLNAKHLNSIVAINTLNQIMFIMDNITHNEIVSKNDSFRFVNSKMTAATNFLGNMEDGGEMYSIYSAAFQVTVMVNNGVVLSSKEE